MLIWRPLAKASRSFLSTKRARCFGKRTPDEQDEGFKGLIHFYQLNKLSTFYPFFAISIAVGRFSGNTGINKEPCVNHGLSRNCKCRNQL